METMMRIGKKLTFVVIPDANRSVLQTRISRQVLIGISFAALSLFIFTVIWLLSARNEFMNQIDTLSERVISERRQAAIESADHDRTIENLHNEVLNLADKADIVRKKLQELEKLEHEVRRLSGSTIHVGDARSGDNTDTLAKQQTDVSIASGGAYSSPERKDWLPFTEDIHSRYTELYSEMDQWAERMAEVKLSLQHMERTLRVTPTIWPADSRHITSGFGIRRDPFTRRSAFHNGIDIEGNRGDPVFSSAEGTVVIQGWDKAYGNHIVVEHTKDVSTIYMHLHKILTNRGDTVMKGQQIGQVGSTGRSTGPHLHYEVHKNGTAVDPNPYLGLRRKGKDE